MKDAVTLQAKRYVQGFREFSPGQRAVTVIGTIALLLAGVLLVRWFSQPDYATLYSNMAPADASAVVAKLDSAGIKYKIVGDDTIMVPRADVYKTRIDLNGQGLPTASDSGYSLLDKQSLSTSQFKENTDFKRAMEGELARTVEAMDGVQTAVVHLALPEKQVFSDKQDPATASVLLANRPGATFSGDQVVAIQHLVSSSIDGMKPGDVTVASSNGQLLSSPDGSGATTTTGTKETVDYQNQTSQRLQAILDRVVGPGNATVQVTADLDFDKTTTESKRYTQPNPDIAPLAQSSAEENYKGPAGGNTVTGTVGPDGQMDSMTRGAGGGNSDYVKKQSASDNAVDTSIEKRDKAPGTIRSLHVGVVIDQMAAAGTDTNELTQQLTSALGIKTERGDTLRVSTMAFNRTSEKQAAKELAAQQEADAKDKMMTNIRNGALALLFVALLIVLYIRSRKKAAQRESATTYVIEQLQASRAPEPVALEPPPAMLSLNDAEASEQAQIKEELARLVESQPEDVAALLRGWLVEK